MKNFIVYNSDGQMLKYGQCADVDIALQAGEGQSVLEAEFQPNKKVQDGVLVDDTPTQSELNAEALGSLRTQRFQLLISSDWPQMPDSPLTDTKKNESATYRQTLRDLPASNANVTSIDDVTFPDAPT